MDVLRLLKEGLAEQINAEYPLHFPNTVDHHISKMLFKFDVNSLANAVAVAVRQEIIK